MKTMEALLKRFNNGNVMLILRILRNGRQNVRIYDDYVEICPTVDDFTFMQYDLAMFFQMVNRYNINDVKSENF